MDLFKKIIDIDESKNIEGLTTELRCIYLLKYIEEKNSSIVLVANSLFEANQMYQTLLNYTNNVLFFPMDDFLTSEAIAISPELELNRIETINRIIEDDQKIVVTN